MDSDVQRNLEHRDKDKDGNLDWEEHVNTAFGHKKSVCYVCACCVCMCVCACCVCVCVHLGIKVRGVCVCCVCVCVGAFGHTMSLPR